MGKGRSFFSFIAIDETLHDCQRASVVAVNLFHLLLFLNGKKNNIKESLKRFETLGTGKSFSILLIASILFPALSPSNSFRAPIESLVPLLWTMCGETHSVQPVLHYIMKGLSREDLWGIFFICRDLNYSVVGWLFEAYTGFHFHSRALQRTVLLLHKSLTHLLGSLGTKGKSGSHCPLFCCISPHLRKSWMAEGIEVQGCKSPAGDFKMPISHAVCCSSRMGKNCLLMFLKLENRDIVMYI